MSDKIAAAENLLNNLVDTITEKKSGSFFEGGDPSSASSQFKRLFGRERPVHNILGGGKSADVLLWRNKKISASVLASATLLWLLFEWLNYNFLTLVSFALIFVMLGQFLWSNASGLVGREPSEVPRLVIPEDLFVRIATRVGVELNRDLRFLQDIACGGNLKQFLIAVASLWAVAIIGTWFNVISVIYIGFVAAHTLPVLYEKYEDQIDSFVGQLIDQMQHNYKKLDAGVLSKIPKGSFRGKKLE